MVRRWLLVAAALAVIAIVATAAWSPRRAPVDETVGDVARVGVRDGDSVPRYVAASAGRLAALAERRPVYALVTFSRYATPAGTVPLLAGTAPARAFTRVPLAGVQTSVVSHPVDTLAIDISAGMRRTATTRTADAARKEDLARAADAGSALRAVYARSAAVDRAEAAAYRRLCACVYAAVVRGDAAALRRVAARPGVRAVEPAPQVTRLDRAVFVAPLPEQVAVVEPPDGSGAVPVAPTAPRVPPGPPVPSVTGVPSPGPSRSAR